MVGVWGMRPTAQRGMRMAARRGAGVLWIEDAWLRSLHPGRAGEPPVGLLIDRRGVHYDPARPSELEHLLATHPLDDADLLEAADTARLRMREAHVSKYSATDPGMPCPTPGYVLVVDQTRGDASVTASGADATTFAEMLAAARSAHPDRPIVIKTHPETAAGFRTGHFGAGDAGAKVTLADDPLSPWDLLEGAAAVYTVSSQLGFEAILAGHRPCVFGQPFYAGWGLSDDAAPVARRQRRLSAQQLCAAALILYPVWYDPFRDRLCDLETVIEALAASARCWREDRHGWVASGMRRWKRKPLQRIFGLHKPVRFGKAEQPGTRRPMVWAAQATAQDSTAVKIEEGFLRSRGLGADLVPPLSLVADDMGIYYDPAQPSRLEQWIAARAELRQDQRQRAQALITQLTDTGVTKYTLGGTTAPLPDGPRILVAGQVEDDASVLTGAGELRRNVDLLRAARAAHPDARIIYKPHPDVEAGLRPGACDTTGLADYVAREASVPALLAAVDRVWTMTSLLGFEALLRGVPVTTTGAPFYAGWGLTDDRGTPPARRTARPDLPGLVHATLIDYPRYVDPVSGLPCPVEVVVARLAEGHAPQRGLTLLMLSVLQRRFAGQAWLWRR